MNWQAFGVVFFVSGLVTAALLWVAFIAAMAGYIEERFGYGWAFLSGLLIVVATIATAAGVFA